MPSRERRFIHVPPLRRGDHESFSDPLRPFWGPEYRHRIKQRLSGVCHWAASQGVLSSVTGPSSFWLQALLKGVRTAWILLLLWLALALASSISMRAFTVPQGVWFKKGKATSVSLLTIQSVWHRRGGAQKQEERSPTWIKHWTNETHHLSSIGYPQDTETNSSEVLKVEHRGHSRRDDRHWLVIQPWPQERRANWCPLFGVGYFSFWDFEGAKKMAYLPLLIPGEHRCKKTGWTGFIPVYFGRIFDLMKQLHYLLVFLPAAPVPTTSTAIKYYQG